MQQPAKKTTVTRSDSNVKSGDNVYNFEVDFPAAGTFLPSNKLPTYRNIVGLLRHLLEGKGRGRGVTVDIVCREVAKQVISKWFHDTVYYKSITTVLKMVKIVHTQYTVGKQRLARPTSDGFLKFVELFEMKDSLFDIYPCTNGQMDGNRISTCIEEWGGLRMSARDKEYYEDQKGPRVMVCENRCDPVFYLTWLKRQREREKKEEWVKIKEEQFRFKDHSFIEKALVEEGLLLSDDEDTTATVEVEVEEEKKKRKVNKTVQNEGDSFPTKYEHLRDGARRVKPDFYQTCAALTGSGLSVPEAASSIVTVANKMFGRSWKIAAKNDKTFVNDTAPDDRNIRLALQLQEVEGMARIVEAVQEGREQGRAITHSSDSTTKKGAGQFMVSGFHVGQDIQLDLPILPIYGEKTVDIAMQIDMGMEVLAASKGMSAGEIYQMVDVHMTDSVEHNKGISPLLAELYDLDTVAGQIFCNTHTTLGFSSGMNKVMRTVELGMKMEEVVSSFMVDLDYDTKNSSIAGQALDMMLRLVAPEYSHKPWNRHGQFMVYLKEHGHNGHLFAYKDARFGLLSRAAAIAHYHYDHISSFLDDFPDITNRLACLVREVMVLPYLKPVLVVWATLGLQLVEPFYARTIQQGATHSSLKVFFKEIYESMEQEVDESYFCCDKPALAGVSEGLFCSVKKGYTQEVVDVVVEQASLYMEEVKQLTNLTMVEVRQVLARQRRDYGIDEQQFPAQYPVMEQAGNIDDTVVTNIGMERSCGLVDDRLQHLNHLEAVSRSIILKKTQSLRENKPSDFRGYKEELEKVKELKLNWSKAMAEKQTKGSDEKQEVAKQKEAKRLDTLDFLKSEGGPFTDEREVEEYLSRDDIEEKQKVKRMKVELQNARDSSTLLPKTDPIFRIQVTVPETGKRRQKTPEEFGETLRTLLGRRSNRTTMEYTSFKTTLQLMFLGNRRTEDQ